MEIHSISEVFRGADHKYIIIFYVKSIATKIDFGIGSIPGGKKVIKVGGTPWFFSHFGYKLGLKDNWLDRVIKMQYNLSHIVLSFPCSKSAF